MYVYVLRSIYIYIYIYIYMYIYTYVFRESTPSVEQFCAAPAYEGLVLKDVAVSDLIFNRRLKPMEINNILSPSNSSKSRLERDVSLSRDEESLKPKNHEARDKKKRNVELQERIENALIEQSKYIDKMRHDLDEDNESMEDGDSEKESNDDSDDDEALEKKAAYKATTRRGGYIYMNVLYK
jgi:hypothetical protein